MDYSHVFNAHPSFIEQMYRKYQADAHNVDQEWRLFFEGFDFNTGGSAEVGADGVNMVKEFGVMSIIHGFRSRGHLLSTTNPIRERKDRRPHLDLADYALEESDLDKRFNAAKEIGLNQGTLREILAHLRKLYSGNIGFEYTHIESRSRRMWLRDKFESRAIESDYGLTIEVKKRILDKLNGATIFEKFLHTKYIGQKRFSLEGGESTIAALDRIILDASEDGVNEVVIGMAHRGRLNVLANIMGKTYEQIFEEFEGTAVPDLSFGDGDVKYHLGFSSQLPFDNGRVLDLKLVPNPSHLEAVGPVVEGFSRAKADVLYDSEYDKILPILIHGDAAVVGQGVVYETAQMSGLEGYYTGGTVHFVINNQIGFTTDFDDARTSTYCTAAGKMTQAPIFHVNGDDPEAVIYAAQLAFEYRQKFNTDVYIDMVCYRKHGHNEGDDPKFTQPEMYKIINDHPNPREIYVQKLIERGDLQKDIADKLEEKFWAELQERLDETKQQELSYTYQETEEIWRSLKLNAHGDDFKNNPVTGISEKYIRDTFPKLLNVPEGFSPLGKVNRLNKTKKALWEKDQLDWSMGEWMAYASLLTEGHDVRMSGQDCKRGTFSHRHAVLHDSKTYEEYNRFSRISDDQGQMYIYNSLLSEFAVMGFEYGYSLANPSTLVIWEGQFGDFYNGAQVMVDQFISAAESKWHRMSGLVLLLPHGYAGQGPEHSSARLERFLQLCAEDNMIVANISTPANFFHIMRRQLKWNFRKPLIIMSPKSLLRHPLCVSELSEFAEGTTFQEVKDDLTITRPSSVKRLVLCSGKIYYDLHMRREELGLKNKVAIVRIEQLYPYPDDQIAAIRKRYSKAEILWVQEEPENMGAWSFIMPQIGQDNVRLISRKRSASPATGFKKAHDMQQEAILEAALVTGL